MRGRHAMAERAARASQATALPSRDLLQPATRLLGRFGLHVLAVLIGVLLMLPFYWAVSSSLKHMTEVRQIPRSGGRTSPNGTTTPTSGRSASSPTGSGTASS